MRPVARGLDRAALDPDAELAVGRGIVHDLEGTVDAVAHRAGGLDVGVPEIDVEDARTLDQAEDPLRFVARDRDFTVPDVDGDIGVDDVGRSRWRGRCLRRGCRGSRRRPS